LLERSWSGKKNHHRSLLFTNRCPPLRQPRIRSVTAYGPSYRFKSFELHKILRAMRTGQFFNSNKDNFRHNNAKSKFGTA
jgi:hypothetical protein